MKIWQRNDIYNFSDEFNRIEKYIEWCKEWLAYYKIQVIVESKTNWVYNDIVDLQDYNRVKNNINLLLQAIQSNLSLLEIRNEVNQNFNEIKANDIEQRLYSIIDRISEEQWRYNITGLTITGNSMKLGGIS